MLEVKAQNDASEAIAKHPKSEYVVMREGWRTTITEDELLIGDLIYVKAGMKIPVDGLMVKGQNLKVSEWYSFGEAHPLPKKTIENCQPLKSCPIIMTDSHVNSGCGWVLSLAIG